MNEENTEIPQTKLKNVTKLTDILKESLTLDAVRMPPLTRLKNRMNVIRELSSAKTIKEPIGLGNMFVHITTPPKMFISQLDSRFDGSKGVITYMTYKTEKHPVTGELRKVIKKQHMKIDDREIEVMGNYVLDNVFIETIEFGKPIKVEMIDPTKIGVN